MVSYILISVNAEWGEASEILALTPRITSPLGKGFPIMKCTAKLFDFEWSVGGLNSSFSHWAVTTRLIVVIKTFSIFNSEAAFFEVVFKNEVGQFLGAGDVMFCLCRQYGVNGSQTDYVNGMEGAL